MPKIKNKLTGLERQVDWRKWTVSPEFEPNRDDWEIISFEPLPIRLYQRPNIREQFEDKGIYDITTGTSLVNQKTQFYRFDELDPKTLKIKRANPKPRINPIKINLIWYKKLSHDGKVNATIAIIALIAMIVIGTATLALM
ncbi:hypothetical protein [Reichenbachiella agariperforans]|uniref:hypothetical protein n=1 Tax=Reichenbachiella agariperforans TaxID=156994 RepID=UPI001C096E84|nr:hypothetical protein [Reichenbachiella agariperforans]MBU2912556.1 hypothetical protein [Reichenbachiella agariperforans]